MKTINGILGLAIGDAMGVPCEFYSRKTLMENPVTEMVGGGSHKMVKGIWSDDTSMTLATIDAIIAKEKIDTTEIANNFLTWFKEAKYTANGITFDVGKTVLMAIIRYEEYKTTPEKLGGCNFFNNGNGSLMRILPIAYYAYAKGLNDKELFEVVRKVSSITHAHEISILGCYIYILFALQLLKGRSLKEAYNFIQEKSYDAYFGIESIEKYNRILNMDISQIPLDEIESSGYVVATLETAFWVLLNTSTYNQVIIGAINLGDDTDTIAAVAGGLAGIYYGEDSIKKEWKDSLVNKQYIEDICEEFDNVIKKYMK